MYCIALYCITLYSIVQFRQVKQAIVSYKNDNTQEKQWNMDTDKLTPDNSYKAFE